MKKKSLLQALKQIYNVQFIIFYQKKRFNNLVMGAAELLINLELI